MFRDLIPELAGHYRVVAPDLPGFGKTKATPRGAFNYSFARVGAAPGMSVQDVYVQNRRLWVRLREKGGEAHAMPCHHHLESYLTAYIEQADL